MTKQECDYLETFDRQRRQFVEASNRMITLLDDVDRESRRDDVIEAAAQIFAANGAVIEPTAEYSFVPNAQGGLSLQRPGGVSGRLGSPPTSLQALKVAYEEELSAVTDVMDLVMDEGRSVEALAMIKRALDESRVDERRAEFDEAHEDSCSKVSADQTAEAGAMALSAQQTTVAEQREQVAPQAIAVAQRQTAVAAQQAVIPAQSRLAATPAPPPPPPSIGDSSGYQPTAVAYEVVELEFRLGCFDGVADPFDSPAMRDYKSRWCQCTWIVVSGRYSANEILDYMRGTGVINPALVTEMESIGDYCTERAL